jgi:hypothetical protein
MSKAATMQETAFKESLKKLEKINKFTYID